MATDNDTKFGYITSILLTLFILISTICISKLASIYWRSRHAIRKTANIPSIRGAVGLDLMLCPMEDTYQVMADYIDKNLPVFKVLIVSKLIVCVCKPEYLKQILMNKNCLGKDELYDVIKPIFGEGLATGSSVDKWAKKRKLLNPVFQQKNLNAFVPIFSKNSSALVDILEKTCQHPEFDLLQKLQRCTFENICETALGSSVDAQTSSHPYVSQVDTFLHYAHLKLIRAVYWIDFVFNLVHGKNYRDTTEIMNTFSKNIWEEQKELHRMRALDKDGTSFEDESNGKLTIFKILLEKNIDEIDHTDKEIVEEINTFIGAGLDTTANTLGYCFLLLGMYPEYQRKLYEEVIDILGADREATVEDLPKFKFMEMCLKETLRLFPPLPFITRNPTADVEFGDYVLPKDTSLIIPLVNLHRCSEYWKDPLVFNPYRFLPEEIEKIHPYAYMPFAKGPRICIGKNYAMVAMKEILSKTVRRFEFKTEYKSVEEVDLTMQLVLRPKNGYKVSMKSRNY